MLTSSTTSTFLIAITVLDSDCNSTDPMGNRGRLSKTTRRSGAGHCDSIAGAGVTVLPLPLRTVGPSRERHAARIRPRGADYPGCTTTPVRGCLGRSTSGTAIPATGSIETPVKMTPGERRYRRRRRAIAFFQAVIARIGFELLPLHLKRPDR